MPLFTNPPSPFVFGYQGDGSSSAATYSANTVTMYAEALSTQITLTNMRVDFGVGGTGHYDVGIYDASGANSGPGNLLGHCASTATSLATATGIQSPALLSNLSLAPGKYWIAVWIDNATDTLAKTSILAIGQIVSQTGSFSPGPLPALASSITGLANTTRKVIAFGLLQGGWS